MNHYDLLNGLTAGTPVLLATVGEIIAERSGILNLSLEGVMLCGGLAAAASYSATGNPWIAVAAAAFVGAIAGLLHASLIDVLGLNMTASGLCLFFVLSGLSAFLGKSLAGISISTYTRAQTDEMTAATNTLIVAAFASSIGAWWFLRYTRTGLFVRAAGENAAAAHSLGIPVRKLRLVCSAVGSALAAMGGALIVLVFAHSWIENATGGRGWVALGLAIVSRWNPLLAVPVALLFGAVVAFQLRLQANGVAVSPYLLSAFPYLAAVAALIGTHWRSRQAATPAELIHNEEEVSNAL